MAYKFQLGTAKLSGSIEQTDGSLIKANTAFEIGAASINETDLEKIDGITDGTAAANKAMVVDGNKDIASIRNLSAVQLSSSANLLVGGDITGSAIALGDASGIAGDGIVNNAGVLDLDIANLGTLLGSGVLADLDTLAINDVSGGGTKEVLFSVVRDNVYSDISGDITVAASGAATIAAGAVENSMMANNSILLNAGAGLASIGAVALGATASVAVDGVLEDLDTLGAASADGEFIVATGAGAFAYESGNTARTSLGLGTGDSPQFTNLTISGDLTVNGTNTILNTSTLVVEDVLITVASGSTSFATGRGIEIGNGSAAVGYFKTAQANIDGAGGNENIWEASLPISASSIAATTYYGDGSNLSGVSATGLTETVQTFNSDGAISSSAGMIVLAQSASTAYGLRLEPAAASQGKLFKIKRVDGQNVTIECDGSETIDGASSVLLESDYAAIMVFSDGSNYFIV